MQSKQNVNEVPLMQSKQNVNEVSLMKSKQNVELSSPNAEYTKRKWSSTYAE